MPRDSDKLDGSLRSFSQGLFRDPVSVKIRDAAVQTKFFRDMVDGTLDPAIYGGYMVQDAAYCFNAVEAFHYAAQQMQEQEELGFSLLYRVMSENFKGYNQEFLKHWKLKSSESVVMGPAAEIYVGFESAISRKDARFLCIAMLPCTMLWPLITRELIRYVNKGKNPYYCWFKENERQPGHKSHLEKFVDSFFKPEEKEKSLRIFQQGLINELNFFRDACGEPLYYSGSVSI